MACVTGVSPNTAVQGTLLLVTDSLTADVNALTTKVCVFTSCAWRHLVINPAQFATLVNPLLSICWQPSKERRGDHC
jgi:hypothetical protein